MLCNEIRKEEYLKNKENFKDYYSELKADGDRCIIADNQIFNRQENNWTRKYPQIKIYNKNTIVDGEMVFLNGNKYRTEFNLGRRKINWEKCVFLVFDVLKFEGKLLIKEKLKDRRKYLGKIKGDNIRLIDEFPNSWEDVEKYKLEGLILKHKNSKYTYGLRSKDWIKVKNVKEEEVIFDGFEENPKGLTLTNKEGLRCACLGWQSKKVKELLEQNEEIRAKIRYLEKTEGGKRRMPTFLGVV